MPGAGGALVGEVGTGIGTGQGGTRLYEAGAMTDQIGENPRLSPLFGTRRDGTIRCYSGSNPAGVTSPFNRSTEPPRPEPADGSACVSPAPPCWRGRVGGGGGVHLRRRSGGVPLGWYPDRTRSGATRRPSRRQFRQPSYGIPCPATRNASQNNTKYNLNYIFN